MCVRERERERDRERDRQSERESFRESFPCRVAKSVFDLVEV